MFGILISLSALVSFSVRHAAATTCHDLQQSQLLSLNERMNQMIDTISALLPTPLKKSTAAVPPTLAPPTDYAPSSPGYESTYYTSPPAYTTPTSKPYIMYVSPPYATLPTAVAIAPHVQPNPVSPPPRHYTPIETDFRPEYAIPSISNPIHWPSRSQYQIERHPLTKYANTIPITHSPPPTYPSAPYSFLQPSGYLTNYNQPYTPEYHYQPSLAPNIPTYPPGQPTFPVPTYLPPNTFVPAYPHQAELLPPQYT